MQAHEAIRRTRSSRRLLLAGLLLAAIAIAASGCTWLLPTPLRPPEVEPASRVESRSGDEAPRPAAGVTLRVIPRVGGRPDAGRDTVVTVRDSGGEEIGWTVAEGGYADFPLPAGTYRVRATFEGASIPYEKDQVVEVVQGRITEVRLEVVPGIGTLRVRPTGPAAKVNRDTVVSVFGPDGTELTWGTTSSSGVVEFVLAPGVYRLQTEYNSSVPFVRTFNDVRVDAGRIREVEVRAVEALAWVRAVPVVNGAPLRDATIDVLDASGNLLAWTYAESDGYAEFELPPGHYWLRAEGGDAVQYRGEAEVDLFAGRTEEVVIDLEVAG